MKDHPVVSHLVKLRVTMEKLRPLDAKLKYQIDKLLKLAASASKAIDESVIWFAIQWTTKMATTSGQMYRIWFAPPA